MLLRFAQITDADALAQLEQACFPKKEAASYEIILQRLHTFPSSFLVMEEDGCIIGMMNGCVSNRQTICDEMYENCKAHQPDGMYQTVFGLDVHPDYQHQGYGHMLMKAFQALAKQQKRKGIILTCKKAKIGFYEALDFQSMGRSNSLHGGVIWYDMIWHCEK